MDEVLFRSSQKFENLQVQLSLAATQSKDLFEQYSVQSKSAIIQAWNSSYSQQVKSHIHALYHYIVSLGIKAQDKIWVHLDPQRLYYNLAKVFWQKWTKRDVGFWCAGFICGSVAGAVFILSIKKKESIVRYMQAIQCTNYLGVESAAVVETALAPDTCSENEVIISVKAGSVQVVDAQICNGYGKTLHRILQRIYNKHSNGGLPVTLGRDCTGIIVDVGSNVKRLEIGDEVWVTVPFWHAGTLSQSVVLPEFRIGRKPKNVGFEGACSLPYAGILALNALKEIQTDKEKAANKRFLVLGGCTPVGCVLIQILKQWKANVTTTCTKRAMPVVKALGAAEIILYPEPVTPDGPTVVSLELPQESLNAFQKELESREKYDFIIITKNCALSTKKIDDFCVGKVVTTVPAELSSDSCGYLGGIAIHSYIYIKAIFEGYVFESKDDSITNYLDRKIIWNRVILGFDNGYVFESNDDSITNYLDRKIIWNRVILGFDNKMLGAPFNDFDEGHMCYVSLDELAKMVENGSLQTVVDKVFHPPDIEIALNHIQSYDSIGSTVITFR